MLGGNLGALLATKSRVPPPKSSRQIVVQDLDPVLQEQVGAIRIEHLHKQPVEFGMDEPRLRQEFLRCGFVVGLGGRGEVRVDEDSPFWWRERGWIAKRSSSRRIST